MNSDKVIKALSQLNQTEEELSSALRFSKNLHSGKYGPGDSQVEHAIRTLMAAKVILVVAFQITETEKEKQIN